MQKMKLKELVVLAMISVVIGVAFLGLDTIYRPLQSLAGPVGGDIIYGLYLISALLSMYLIRKPGAAIAGSLFTGIVNLLLGSPYGINIIVASLLQGIGVEIPAFVIKYKKFNVVTMSACAILAMILVTLRDYFVFGFSLYKGLIPIMLVIRIISSIILGALFTIAIAKAVSKTGVLKGFGIGRREEV